MFKVVNAVLAANGEFNEQPLSTTVAENGVKLADCDISPAKSGKGFNFWSPDGALVMYARASNAVRKQIVEGKLTLEQIAKFGKISQSEWEGVMHYNLLLPDALRGGTKLGTVKALAAKAQPLAKKAATAAEISQMIALD